MRIAVGGSAAALQIAQLGLVGSMGGDGEVPHSAGPEGGHCRSSRGKGQNGTITDEARTEQALGAEGEGSSVARAGSSNFAFSRRLVCLSAPDGGAAASYRSMQTHLVARHVGDGRRGLALCSPRARTGCTTVAVNLALACAQAGINTLLVDANLIRPAVHDFIRPGSVTGGLARMLLSKPDDQEDEICRNVRPNLSVLFAGDSSAQARDLVAQRRFKELIDHCIRSFDFTIVDAPAANDGTDARHVAMAVRYAMLVGRRDMTLLAEMKSVMESLASDRVKLVGSFLTDF